MTYFTSPEAAHAHLLGVSAEYLAQVEEETERFFETYGDSQPYVDPEYRRLVDESDVEMVSAEDRAALDLMLEIEAFHF